MERDSSFNGSPPGEPSRTTVSLNAIVTCTVKGRKFGDKVKPVHCTLIALTNRASSIKILESGDSPAFSSSFRFSQE